MLAMVIYPETQKRAQAELDVVVGRHRIPTFADYENLPYIRAMVKEALRWRPVDPVGLPHRSIEDDWYEGHFIPAGTIVITNVWHLNRDPEIYGADAVHFNPARHLDGKGQVSPGPIDSKEEGHFTYGFGRRICVGRHVANNSLFIDIAMVLWAMNIEPATDARGKPLPIDVDGCVEDGL
ncbi:cytochrome P450, partial [Imleria badia]